MSVPFVVTLEFAFVRDDDSAIIGCRLVDPTNPHSYSGIFASSLGHSLREGQQDASIDIRDTDIVFILNAQRQIMIGDCDHWDLVFLALLLAGECTYQMHPGGFTVTQA